MSDIKLSSGELRIAAVLKPTKAQFFQDLREGDIIEIFHKLEGTTGAARGLYASQFVVWNYTRSKRTYISGNNLVARLACFEVRAV